MSEIILSALEKGEKAKVTSFEGGSLFTTRLHSMGIFKGKTITKLSKIKLGGPVILLIDRSTVAVGEGMANKIKVETIKDICDDK